MGIDVNTDFRHQREFKSASDSKLNSIKISNDVVSSIKSEINTKLNEDEIQKIIRIYQDNQNRNQIQNQSQSQTISQYITPLPDDTSRKTSNDTDDWGTPAVNFSFSGGGSSSPEWKNQ